MSQPALHPKLLHPAEDFIARAATESSMSHKPYQVRCAGKDAEPSAIWLTTELQRYRSSSGNK